MLEIISFDERSLMWSKYDEMNRLWLIAQIDYVRAELNLRKYIYLNRIYEIFGVEWKPGEHKNICYLAEFGELRTDIEQFKEQNRFLIKIYQD